MENKELEPEKEKKGRSILSYSGLGMQTALIIGLGSWFGSWLDERYALEKNWFTLLFVLLSVSLSIGYTIRTLNRWNK